MEAYLPDTAVLERINQGFPESFWQLYRTLIALRDAETLTEDERRELIEMSDQLELRSADRLDYLIELAKRKNTDVRQLMTDLGMRPVSVS